MPGTPYSPCSLLVVLVAPWDQACPGTLALLSGQDSLACLAAHIHPSHPEGRWHRVVSVS